MYDGYSRGMRADVFPESFAVRLAGAEAARR